MALEKGESKLYSANIRSGEFTRTKTQKLLYAIGTDQGLFCAGKTREGIGKKHNGIGLYKWLPDGTQTHLGGFQSPNIFDCQDPLRMALFQGKLYYVNKSASPDKVYCCDTPA